MSRNTATLWLGAVLLGSATGAEAAGWLRLGQQYVDYRSKSVVIAVKPDAPSLTQLKLQVSESALGIDNVKVYLAGGDSFDVPLNAYVGAGRETRAIEVRGGAKTVEKVELTCHDVSTSGRLALVRLLGTS